MFIAELVKNREKNDVEFKCDSKKHFSHLGSSRQDQRDLSALGHESDMK